MDPLVVMMLVAGAAGTGGVGARWLLRGARVRQRVRALLEELRAGGFEGEAVGDTMQARGRVGARQVVIQHVGEVGSGQKRRVLLGVDVLWEAPLLGEGEVCKVELGGNAYEHTVWSAPGVRIEEYNTEAFDRWTGGALAALRQLERRHPFAMLSTVELHPGRLRVVWLCRVQGVDASLALGTVQACEALRWPGDVDAVLREAAAVIAPLSTTSAAWRAARALVDRLEHPTEGARDAEALRELLGRWPIPFVYALYQDVPDRVFGLLSPMAWLQRWNSDWGVEDGEQGLRPEPFGQAMRRLDEALVAQGRGEAFASFWSMTGLVQAQWLFGAARLVPMYVWLIGTDERRERVEGMLLTTLDALLSPQAHPLQELLPGVDDRLCVVEMVERFGGRTSQMWAARRAADPQLKDQRIRRALQRIERRLSHELGDWREQATIGGLSLAEDASLGGALSMSHEPGALSPAPEHD